jgi:hypothetical protein
MRNMFFVALLLFAATALATNVNNAVYEGTDSTYHFDTDMQFTTDSTLRVISGSVVSGDPNNLQSGDTVCSGAVVRVTPAVTARWATPDFAAVGIYPTCGGGYCPAMISYNTVNQNRNIAWLSSATWNTHKTFATTNDFSQSETKYNELGASNFYLQRVTYTNVTGQFLQNKEGGAGVFCKGTIEALDGATVAGTSSMPSAPSFDITVTTNGAHQVGTRLSNVDCFGAIVKHPIDLPAQPTWFWLDYFGNDGPAIPSTMATDTVTLNVQSGGGGTVLFHETQVTASSALTDDQTKVIVRYHNDGLTSINVTGVSSSSASYTAGPFPESGSFACNMGGFGTLCPIDNGFNTPIAAGAERNMHVLVRRLAAGSGTILTFTAQTSGAGGCGGLATGTDQVDLRNIPITCEIAPPVLSLGTLEVARFEVTCYDLGHSAIPCIGTNWEWVTLAGDFVERTNSYALAYTTSPQGTSGTIRYSSGIATCQAGVLNDRPPMYACEFDPPSAEMEVDTSEYFEMNCFVNGTATVPDDASYDLTDGLTGSTSNSSTDGTAYDAPSDPTDGQLRGFGEFGSAPDPIVGAIALADINVINSTNNQTNCTGPNCGCVGPNCGNDGDSDFCTIGSGALFVWPGYGGWISIMCGEHGDEPCTGVHWDISGGTLSNQGDSGTSFTVTGPGSITAYVNDDTTQVCSSQFYIGTPACWEFS